MLQHHKTDYCDVLCGCDVAISEREFPFSTVSNRHIIPIDFQSHQKTLMHGHCLCHQIEFELTGNEFKLYQCHCSLCRRQSGAAANAATIVESGQFRWLRGQKLISSWVGDSGFRSDFCSVCGSPVPNALRGLPYVWVPAGLLEDGAKLDIVAHLHMASKADWDSSIPQGTCHETLPDFAEFIAALQP